MALHRTDEGGIVRLTFDRPERMNALDEPTRAELIAHLRDIRADEGVRCLVISGAGGNFCAGADVKGMTPGRRDFRGQRQVIRTNAHVYAPLLHDLDIPTVAVVEGNAAGVGWSIALACDVVLAADTAEFTSAFGRIGLAPDGGLVWYLTRACGLYAAKDIVLNARTIRAEEALRLGLITAVVAASELASETERRVAELAAGPTLAMAFAKRQFQAALEPHLGAFLEHEALMQPALHSTADFAEGVSAFKEKRKARFTGR